MQANRAEQSVKVIRFFDFAKTSLLHHLRNQAIEIIGRGFETIEQLNEARAEPDKVTTGRAPVGDMKLASRFENSLNLFERFDLILRRKVVKEEAGNNAVKISVLIWQIKRHPFIKTYIQKAFSHFPACDLQDTWISVEPNDVCQRSGFLQ